MSWQLAGDELLLDSSNLTFLQNLETEDLAGLSPQFSLMLDAGAQIMGQKVMTVSLFLFSFFPPIYL
jgi:hypothetical protein